MEVDLWIWETKMVPFMIHKYRPCKCFMKVELVTENKWYLSRLKNADFIDLT